MSQPITPTPPVNAIISVQPLSIAVPGRDAADIPAQIANLPVGTTVQGFVINRDAQSNPILRTNLGDVLVKSDVFIKTGSEVAFRIDTTQTTGRARIVTIDGLTPEDYVGQSGRAVTQDTIRASGIPAPSATATAQAFAEAGPTLEAIVLLPTSALQNSKGAEPIPASLAQLQPGQSLRVVIQSLTLPQAPVSLAQVAQPPTALDALLPAAPEAPPTTAPFPAAGVPPSGVPSPTAPGAAASASSPLPAAAAPAATPNLIPSSPATAATIVPSAPPPAVSPIVASSAAVASPPPATTSGNTSPPPSLSAPLIAQEHALPPSAPNSATTAPTAARAPVSQPLSYAAYAPESSPNTAQPPRPTGAPSLQATVIGHEGDGATVLHTPVATLKLYTPQHLPYGSQLTLTATPSEEAPPVTALPPGNPQALLLKKVSDDLQSLAEQLLAPGNTAPPGTPPLALALPQPDARLSSTLLFFLAAIKSADPKDWLGSRTLDRLRLSAPELVARLSDDLAQLNPLAAPQPNSPWSSTLLPILHQQTVHPALLYFQHDGEGSSPRGNKGTGSGQRFIVDVELSQLGNMQFDGFVRKGEKRPQLDLVIRSARPLPEDVAQGIRATFTSTLETTGMQGQAIFQLGTQHFVRPLAERSADNASPPNTILA